MLDGCPRDGSFCDARFQVEKDGSHTSFCGECGLVLPAEPPMPYFDAPALTAPTHFILDLLGDSRDQRNSAPGGDEPR